MRSWPPVALLAVAALIGLAGFLLGAGTAPGVEPLTTARVASYDAAQQRLCLSGEAARALATSGTEGILCGRWEAGEGQARPRRGEAFRFVAVRRPGGVRLYGATVD